MPRYYTILSSLSVLLFILCTFTGCNQENITTECPFIEFTWGSTAEKILGTEGAPDNSYSSTYGGMTYVFDNREYNGLNGSIKYFFNEDHKLVSAAWMYIPENTNDKDTVYNALYEQTRELYGESGFESNRNTVKSSIWHLENGNIFIGALSTGVNETIQYQFFSPETSIPSSDT